MSVRQLSDEVPTTIAPPARDPWEATTVPDLLTSISALDALIDEVTELHERGDLQRMSPERWSSSEIPELDASELIELL